MADKSRATLSIEPTANGQFEWLINIVEHDIGTMPRQERSTSQYASEAEARLAGEQALRAIQHN